MDTKSLLIGIISFIAGGLLVSIAAVTFEKEPAAPTGMTMDSMTAELHGKTGDDFDEAFTRNMIEHHEGAVEMARLAERQAEHREIKDMSRDIINAQEREIQQMQDWRRQWGFGPAESSMPAGH
jgi:uncharacterized protein (DUF305 family)